MQDLFIQYPEIVLAVEAGDLTKAVRLIDEGHNVNHLFSVNGEKQVPIFRSIYRSDLNMTRLLLEKGAEPDILLPSGTPLNIAVQVGNREIIQLLLEYGVDINGKMGNSPLFSLALANNREKLLEFMLQNGANLYVVDGNNKSVAQYFIENDLAGCLQLLLNRGLNISDLLIDGWRPFAYAINNNLGKIFQLLLERGEDVNQEVPTTAGMQTPLCRALYLNNEKMSQELLKKGAKADIEVLDAGIYPLNIALSVNNPRLVEMIIQHGGDVNKINRAGEYPIFYPTLYNQPACLEVLLKHGCKINNPSFDKDDELEFPLETALRMNSLPTMELLLSHGTDSKALAGEKIEALLQKAIEGNNYAAVKIVLEFKRPDLINLLSAQTPEMFTLMQSRFVPSGITGKLLWAIVLREKESELIKSMLITPLLASEVDNDIIDLANSLSYADLLANVKPHNTDQQSQIPADQIYNDLLDVARSMIQLNEGQDIERLLFLKPKNVIKVKTAINWLQMLYENMSDALKNDADKNFAIDLMLIQREAYLSHPERILLDHIIKSGIELDLYRLVSSTKRDIYPEHEKLAGRRQAIWYRLISSLKEKKIKLKSDEHNDFKRLFSRIICDVGEPLCSSLIKIIIDAGIYSISDCSKQMIEDAITHGRHNTLSYLFASGYIISQEEANASICKIGSYDQNDTSAVNLATLEVLLKRGFIIAENSYALLLQVIPRIYYYSDLDFNEFFPGIAVNLDSDLRGLFVNRHEAEKQRLINTARSILAGGVNPNIYTSEYDLPLSSAIDCNIREFVDLYLQFNAVVLPSFSAPSQEIHEVIDQWRRNNNWEQAVFDFGSPKMIYNLSYRFFDQESGNYDAPRGFTLMKRAADLGYAEAEFDYGNSLITGYKYLPRDFEEGLYYLKRAANHGSQEAKKKLRGMYKFPSADGLYY